MRTLSTTECLALWGGNMGGVSRRGCFHVRANEGMDETGV